MSGDSVEVLLSRELMLDVKVVEVGEAFTTFTVKVASRVGRASSS
jgi:hypothetical protein